MPTPSNTDETLIDEATQNRIKLLLVNKARKFAPAHIAPHITSDNATITKTKDGYSVGIVARVADYKKFPGIADARAQEYGSGIHSTRSPAGHQVSKSSHQIGGPTGKILIKPKKAGGLLAFHWEGKISPIYIDRKKALKSNTIKSTRKKINTRELTAQLKKLKSMAAPSGPAGKIWEKMKADRIAKMELAIEAAKISNKAIVIPMGANYDTARLEKEKDLFLLNRVKHPGIRPYKGRGYMRPAKEEAMPEIEKLVGENAMKNLRLKIRAIFSRPGGENK